tara:strand:+ start:283 stop:1008 length:726 start_codon:yes stop_codon:yes gene_type:complete
MALFQPYTKAQREEVPGILQAEIADAKAKSAAQAAENSARSMNMLGGATIYNQGMKAAGKSPISDFIGETFNGTPTSTNALPNDPSVQQSMDVMDAGQFDPSVNPGATGPVDPSMATDPLAGAVEANAAVVDPLTGANSSGIGGTIPEGISPVTPDMGISGTAPVGDPLTSIAGEALGVEAGGTAALESALASNAAAGTGVGTAAGGTAAGGAAAGGGAMSSALAALGPIGAIAALAALFG